jgi:hypothetical protein
MSTPWIAILRTAIVGAFEGPNGDYPSVLETVNGLTAIQAVWKPSAGRHSIWQIVDHLAKSKEWECRILEGERLPRRSGMIRRAMTPVGGPRSRGFEPLRLNC